MMTNIQNVSSQLMKSPKELASWNFPLSQILEEYFNLLPEPCKIHYGEAALVIQNSVNAYVRRVEELYDETRCLSKKVVVELKENDEKHFQKEQKSKRCFIDFTRFDLIDFDTEMGKNINLKNQDGKSIKFLHHCFSQLENPYARLQIEVFDTEGETIGKKYSFRCNQQITNNGTLVEELTPKDFGNILVHENDVYSSCTLLERSTKINEDTDFFSNNTRDEFEKAPSECNLNVYDKSMQNFHASSVQDSGCFSLYQNESQHSQNCSSFGFKQIKIGYSQNDENDENDKNHENDENDENDKNDEVFCCEDNFSNSDTYNDYHNLTNETNFSNLNLKILDNEYKINYPIQQKGSSEYNTNISDMTVKSQFQKHDIESSKKETKLNCKKRNSENTISDSVDVCNPSNSTCRRSKRLKQANSVLNNDSFGKNLLKPIPFKDGIPEKLIRSRKEFRLPCHINLLKRNPYKRKTTKIKNKLLKQSYKELSKNSDEKTVIKNMKMTMYSPSRPQEKFTIMKEEDQNGFLRSLDETFNVKHRFDVNYDPVTTLTMDLLGFHLNCAKEDSDRITRANSNLSSPQCTPPPSPTPDNFTPPMSPSFDILISTKTFIDEKEKVRIKSVHNFEKLVKNKIKKIYEELDLQTDEDQNIARWHEEIKPRLLEAERKPPFRIHEYETRIIKRLESCDRKLEFDEIVKQEPRCEVARYFSATLQLASTNNLNINANEDLNKSIELILLD